MRGAGGGRSLLYNGHIDVVPPGNPDLWTDDPFSGERRDGRILGRGSTDMKAGVLAQAYAAVALQRAGVRLQGDLTMVAVVGEEVGDHERGTTATIERGYRADVAVISEPSAPPDPLAIVPVTPGLLWFAVRVPGKAAHAGLRGETVHPTIYGEALGVNAIDKAFLVYETFRRLEDEWAQTKRHPLFPNGKFALLPGVIHGSPHGIDVPFFLAESCTIEYCVAFHPDDDCASHEGRDHAAARARRAARPVAARAPADHRVEARVGAVPPGRRPRHPAGAGAGPRAGGRGHEARRPGGAARLRRRLRRHVVRPGRHPVGDLRPGRPAAGPRQQRVGRRRRGRDELQGLRAARARLVRRGR